MPARSDKEKPAMEHIRRAKVTTPSEREIVIERVFDAPRTLVFEAWTKAEHVVHWWDPSGAPLAVCYREITPPSRLVIGGPSPVSNGESVCTLAFSEQGGKTTLTMTFECQSKADRDALLQMRVDEGTTQTLDNLDEYLRAIG
jgi:uncharacterized protein YndB with AHSA1/START domain